MPLDSPRIAELRRRVQADPSSIAFAQLAEEYRRGGSYEEAVQVCRAGLDRHSGYLSARVTLGRALMELGQLDEAEQEFDLVLGTAPDNLAAIRGVAEISQRRGHMHVALGHYQRALSLARHDPDLEETVAQISREIGGARPVPASGLSFEQARSELESAAERVPLAGADPGTDSNSGPEGPPVVAHATALEPGPAESHGAPTPAGARPFDFDSLLGSLGETPESPAPPIVEAWLAGVAPPVEQAARDPLDPAPSGRPEEPPADEETTEFLAQLEEDLRRFDSEPSQSALGPDPQAGANAEVEAEPPRSAHDLEDQAVVDDLERWLEVLQDAHRGGSSPSA